MVLYKDYKLDLDTILEKQEILKRIRKDDVYYKLLNISLKALTNDYFSILNIKSISKERFYIIIHQLLENLDMYEILEKTGYIF